MSSIIEKEIKTNRVRWLDILILSTVLVAVFILSFQINQTLSQVSSSQDAVKTDRLIVDAVVTSHSVISYIEHFRILPKSAVDYVMKTECINQEHSVVN